MSKLQANLHNSKEYQALKAQFPSENLPTEIVEGNKDYYSFVGYTIATANGATVKLDWKLFSMSKELYNQHEIKKTLKAQNFGHAALIMIHNPVTYAKEQAERIALEESEKEAANIKEIKEQEERWRAEKEAAENKEKERLLLEQKEADKKTKKEDKA